LAFLLVATVSLHNPNTSLFAGLSVFFLAIISRKTQLGRWPWYALGLVALLALTQLANSYASISSAGLTIEVSLHEFTQPITFEGFDPRNPVFLGFIVLLITLWTSGPAADKRELGSGAHSTRSERVALWMLVGFIPLALLIDNCWEGISLAPYLRGEGIIAMDLRGMMLSWMPALILLAGIQFARPQAIRRELGAQQAIEPK